MNSEILHRNIGLDLVRATEAAAIQGGRWMGLGDFTPASEAAGIAMARVLNSLGINGRIVIGEEDRVYVVEALHTGRSVGSGRGVAVDVVADPIDGRRMLAGGRGGAISVVAVASAGAMWSPASAIYMDKLVVNREVANALVPECLDAPAAWTLGLVARTKHKAVRDLVVFVLDRPRHADLIDEIRDAGARVMLSDDGDIAGAILAASLGGRADLLMGIGGAPEGVIAACAVKALGGAMLARLAPQSAVERAAVRAAGLDESRILSADEIVAGDQIFFVATGMTDGVLLDGVRYQGDRAETHSLILRCQTRTRRSIRAEHLIEEHPNTV